MAMLLEFHDATTAAVDNGATDADFAQRVGPLHARLIAEGRVAVTVAIATLAAIHLYVHEQHAWAA